MGFHITCRTMVLHGKNQPIVSVEGGSYRTIFVDNKFHGLSRFRSPPERGFVLFFFMGIAGAATQTPCHLPHPPAQAAAGSVGLLDNISFWGFGGNHPWHPLLLAFALPFRYRHRPHPAHWTPTIAYCRQKGVIGRLFAGRAARYPKFC